MERRQGLDPTLGVFGGGLGELDVLPEGLFDHGVVQALVSQEVDELFVGEVGSAGERHEENSSLDEFELLGGPVVLRSVEAGLLSDGVAPGGTLTLQHRTNYKRTSRSNINR